MQTLSAARSQTDMTPKGSPDVICTTGKRGWRLRVRGHLPKAKLLPGLQLSQCQERRHPAPTVYLGNDFCDWSHSRFVPSPWRHIWYIFCMRPFYWSRKGKEPNMTFLIKSWLETIRREGAVNKTPCHRGTGQKSVQPLCMLEETWVAHWFYWPWPPRPSGLFSLQRSIFHTAHGLDQRLYNEGIAWWANEGWNLPIHRLSKCLQNVCILQTWRWKMPSLLLGDMVLPS